MFLKGNQKILSWLLIFTLTGCSLIPSDDEDKSFFISMAGSLSLPLINGFIKTSGTQSNNLELTQFSVTDDQIFFTLKNDRTGDLNFTFDTKNGNYSITNSQSQTGTMFVEFPYFYSPYTLSGNAEVKNLSIETKDHFRGKVSFQNKGSINFQFTTSSWDLEFDFNVSFDNRNDPDPPPATPVSGNTGGWTGGTPGGDCENTINIENAVSYYSFMNLSSSRLVNGSGKKIKADQYFADYSANDIGLILDGTHSSGVRYQVIILIPSSKFKEGSVDFNDDNDSAGLSASGGAVGVLVSIDEVSDSWRTNRDFGDDKNMGNLNITSLTSNSVSGDYSFTGSGDGYPPLNSQVAKVSGKFCIKW